MQRGQNAAAETAKWPNGKSSWLDLSTGGGGLGAGRGDYLRVVREVVDSRRVASTELHASLAFCAEYAKPKPKLKLVCQTKLKLNCKNRKKKYKTELLNYTDLNLIQQGKHKLKTF